MIVYKINRLDPGAVPGASTKTFKTRVFLWGRNRIDRCCKNMRRFSIIKVTAKSKSTFASILSTKVEVTSPRAQALAAIA